MSINKKKKQTTIFPYQKYSIKTKMIFLKLMALLKLVSKTILYTIILTSKNGHFLFSGYLFFLIFCFLVFQPNRTKYAHEIIYIKKSPKKHFFFVGIYYRKCRRWIIQKLVYLFELECFCRRHKYFLIKKKSVKIKKKKKN